ncbi:MAG: YjiH family protein [Cetobacterium sp.]|uniref:YjiH family protein n=1 Tax=unclassified Cetobacterium TaxID=2630983 RepID=UPI00163D2A6E|nr:YjiH family protein [Cetobacterium sp. 2A]MBC2856932.1 YjiH family protein [Cetobacterium sp. 2A]
MAILKFGLYSTLGILAFLAPISIGGESSILMAHIKTFVIGGYLEWVKALIIAFSVVTIVGTSIGLVKKKFNDEILNEFFVADKVSSVLRILGSVMFLMVTFKFGPSAVLSDSTGALMAFELLPSLMVTFFIGVLLMPMLTSFGLVEFVGTLIAPVMRKLFKVPGYAAIDALASFLGDGTIGIVVTDQQYQKGYYTQRQAVIIATSFSIVGISFAAVVADLLKLSKIFGVFYGTIVISTVIAGFIIARLPLKKFKDEYYNEPILGENENRSFGHALKMASQAASKASEVEMIKDSLIKIIVIYITFIPVIMCVGTTGLIIAEHTNFFAIISMPLLPILNFLGFTHEVATQMAPAMIVGLSDMYLPALFIEGSSSELARFIIGTLSFSQLIFLSETGMILVNSKIGFSFLDAIKFFILRTAITFPVIYTIGIILVKFGILAN